MSYGRSRVVLVAVLSISLGGLVGVAPAFSRSQRGAADVHCRPRGCVDQRDLARGSVSTSKIDPGAVTTAKLSDGSVTSSKIEDGTVQIVDLAFDPLTQTVLDGLLVDLSTSDGNAPNNGSNQVHWDNLTGVPSDFADGVDEAGSSVPAGPASDLVCTGCVGATDLDGNAVNSGKVVDNSLSGDDLGTDSVGSDEVDDGSLGSADLGTDSVGSDEVDDNSLTSDDLGTGSVGTDEVDDDSLSSDDLGTNSVGTDEVENDSLTSDDLGIGSVAAFELADDSVDTNAIQDRAVTSDKILANYAFATGGGPLATGPNEVFLVEPAINVVGSDDHAVLISGQVQLTCSTCTTTGDEATVSWQLQRDGLAIGPVYSATLVGPTTGTASTVASISYIDQVTGENLHTYDLVVTVGDPGLADSVEAVNPLLNVLDVGAVAP